MSPDTPGYACPHPQEWGYRPHPLVSQHPWGFRLGSALSFPTLCHKQWTPEGQSLCPSPTFLWACKQEALSKCSLNLQTSAWVESRGPAFLILCPCFSVGFCLPGQFLSTVGNRLADRNFMLPWSWHKKINHSVTRAHSGTRQHLLKNSIL